MILRTDKTESYRPLSNEERAKVWKDKVSTATNASNCPSLATHSEAQPVRGLRDEFDPSDYYAPDPEDAIQDYSEVRGS